jgi:hypothetical protein
MSDSPIVHSVDKRAGIAGQVEYRARVEYPGEAPMSVSFVGSPTYGGPVVMVNAGGAQTFVTDPDRFGAFGIAWVRRFFGADES